MAEKERSISERWADEKEVAALTGFSVSTLQKFRFYNKGFPYSKIGKTCRYWLPDIQAYMNARKIQTDKA